MLKKILPIVLTLPITAYAAPDCKIIDEGKAKNLPLNAIRDFVQTFVYEQSNVPALMIGIIADDEKTVIACGETVKSNNQLPNLDTIWPIGSVSKVFTADILARMVNQGKVRLNSPINELLGLTTNSNYNISLLDLATHSSGFPRQLPTLPNNDDYQINIPYEMPEFLKWYQTYKPTIKLGTHYNYSNVGYGLLGQLLAKKMGMDFEGLLNEQVVKPLGLKDTTTNPSKEQKKREVASYWLNGDLIKKDWVFKFEQPSGGIYSTMRDMLVFANYQAGLLNQGLENVKLAQASYIYQGEFDNPYSFGEDAMALGWTVDYPKAHLPLRLVKNGWVNGVNTYLRVFPSKKISMVSLTSKPYLNILSDLDKIGAMILAEQEKRSAHE